MGSATDRAAVRVFRNEHAQVFAALWRRLGEFDLVESAMADAYLAAMASWGSAGVPQNPTSWMATVAMSATTSVLSRRGGEITELGAPDDDVRALLFTCCQPALDADERVVCLARAAAGLMVSEIAALLGVTDAVVQGRLNQAKRVMRKPGHGLAMPKMEADGSMGGARAGREGLIRSALAALVAAPGAEAAEIGALLTARVNTALS